MKKDKRNKLIQTRLTKKEMQMIKDQADRLGLSVSAYVRDILHSFVDANIKVK